MKRVANFILISVFSAGLAFAQSTGTAQPNQPAPPNPANMVQRRVQRLTNQLGLSADQQAQATTIFTNAAGTEAGILSNMKTARENLRTAVQNNDQNTINSVSTQVGALTGQLTAAEALADAQFYQILTPDQQSKLTQRGHGIGPLGPGVGPGPMGGFGPNGFRPRGR